MSMADWICTKCGETANYSYLCTKYCHQHWWEFLKTHGMNDYDKRD